MCTYRTLAEITGNDWNVLQVPRPCFIASFKQALETEIEKLFSQIDFLLTPAGIYKAKLKIKVSKNKIKKIFLN